MKALTIRNLPQEVADAVQKRAEAMRASLSKALIALLQDHVAESHPFGRKKRDLSYIAGTWTKKEAREFDKALREQRQIDPKMWK